MFNLDQAISEWRRRMMATGVKALDILDELESHLRENIDEQMQAGSNPEEALEIGVRRIGNPDALRSEFAKVGGGRWAFLRRLRTAFLRASLRSPSLSAFTDSARQTLELAGMEAPRLHHDFIGTEHVLLGMLSLENGVLRGVLKRMGVDPQDLRDHVEKLAGIFRSAKMSGRLPYTPRVKKALSLAAREAKACHSPAVGPEHIFVGLLVEGDGIAGRVLKNLGLTAETTRAEILKELDQNQAGA
jgi:hypothetical protein